jgi:hypothetical protein
MENPIRSKLIRTIDAFIPKRISNASLEKMVSNMKIRDEMAIFLNSELSFIHKNETNWKIHSLVKKWQSMMSNKKFDLFDGVCNVIETNPKFKLPWTSVEVEQAISSTKKIFGISSDLW